MTCERIGELFSIASNTPVRYDETIDIILSEEGSVSGIRYQAAPSEQSIDQAFSISVDPLQFRYILDKKKVIRGSRNGSILDVPIDAWKLATPFEQLDIYRDFLVGFHTEDAPIIFPNLYGLTPEDLVLEEELSSPTRNVYSVQLSPKEELERIIDLVQSPIVEISPSRTERSIPKENILEDLDFYAIAPLVEDPTLQEDYFREDNDDVFEFEEAPEGTRRIPNIPETVTATPEIPEEYQPPQKLVTEAPENSRTIPNVPETITEIKPELTIEYLPTTEGPIITGYVTPTGLSIPAITERTTRHLLNICENAKEFDLDTLRIHFNGVDTLVQNAHPATWKSQDSLYLVSDRVIEFDETQALEVVACSDLVTYRPIAKGTLTPRLE